MKKEIRAYWLAALLMSAAASQAEVLMDYNDFTIGGGHDVAVRDGGFENTTAPGADKVTFDQMPNWTNLAGKQSDYAARKEAKYTEGYGRYAVIESTLMGREVRCQAQSLGYTVTGGERFAASFAWNTIDAWPDTGKIDLVLFYTDDNTLTGTRHDVLRFSSDEGPTRDAWKSKTFEPQALTAPVPAGKTLMVRFSTRGAFPRRKLRFAFVDHVFIEVVR